MNILDLIGQVDSAGTSCKIPWNEPAFSQRMLANHLSQEHDWASRRRRIISRHVDWLTGELDKGAPEPGSPADVLDLGCGPGFYTQLLAERGHHCVGVDFSPASIEYAREKAAASSLDIEYVLGDIRDFREMRQFDCIMLIFGEINVFSKEDARSIITNCAGMLRPGGFFLLEAHTFEAVLATGTAPATWQALEQGLFSDRPHLFLQRNHWDKSTSCAVSNYFVLDAASAEVSRFSSVMQSYADVEYEGMLRRAGFGTLERPDATVWQAGEYFEGKLQLFQCRCEGLSQS